MEKILLKNAIAGKWVFGTFIAGSIVLQKGFWTKKLIDQDVFGADGNGGHMLKIITNLTDEEMARLKYVRRLAWHWKGTRTGQYGKDNINDQELADRGIEVPKETYVEYVKRPPHDKYL